MKQKFISQNQRLAKMLLKSKRGLTSVEIQNLLGTVCPHKRISDLKQAGMKIIKVATERDGCKYAYKAEA